MSTKAPVRIVKRADRAPEKVEAENPENATLKRDTISLEDIRRFAADIRRRMNSLDEMLKRAQQ